MTHFAAPLACVGRLACRRRGIRTSESRSTLNRKPSSQETVREWAQVREVISFSWLPDFRLKRGFKTLPRLDRTTVAASASQTPYKSTRAGSSPRLLLL